MPTEAIISVRDRFSMKVNELRLMAPTAKGHSGAHPAYLEGLVRTLPSAIMEFGAELRQARVCKCP